MLVTAVDMNCIHSTVNYRPPTQLINVHIVNTNLSSVACRVYTKLELTYLSVC